MNLKERFLDLFAKALTGARPHDVAKSSERKPQHGHESRQARRLLGRKWVYSRAVWRRDGQLTRQRAYGDPPTTGRLETSSERKHRRAREQRCRATGHELALIGFDDERKQPVLGPCRCGEARP